MGYLQWGNGGSCFVPVQIETAKKNGKAYFILPGQHPASVPYCTHAWLCCHACVEHKRFMHCSSWGTVLAGGAGVFFPGCELVCIAQAIKGSAACMLMTPRARTCWP